MTDALNTAREALRAAGDFIEDEAGNRAHAGSEMSDYEREPRELLERIDAALATLNATPPAQTSEQADDWDLEIEVCGMVNAAETPANCKALLTKLWRAYCGMEQRVFHHPEAGAPSREALCRLIHETIIGSDADELIHHPAAKSWEPPTEPRWKQWGELADAILALYPTPPALKASELGEDQKRRAVPLSTISEGWRLDQQALAKLIENELRSYAPCPDGNILDAIAIYRREKTVKEAIETVGDWSAWLAQAIISSIPASPSPTQDAEGGEHA